MKVDSKLIEKYHSGLCSIEEQKAVEAWLDSGIFNEKLFLSENHAGVKQAYKDKMWADISQSIDKPNTEHVTNGKEVSSPLWMAKKWLVAASISLLVGMASYFMLFDTSIATYQTLAGQKQTITLKDGTIVYLNANSTLETPSEFTEDTRTVKLTGEAYFEVTKDSLKPFIVETEKSQTTVLGTKFNLYAFSKEKTVLTLNEGKVSFKDKNNLKGVGLILLPNEQGILAGNVLKKKNVKAKYYNSWIGNDMFFDESLASIFKTIERKFDVAINVKDKSLLTKTYRGFHPQANLKDLLKELSFVMKFKYKIKGKTITIN